mmetsp:Transcript_19001/g.41170  ORF Transcript_19001/g.41170 Transcript_19001/m.41170 type:complete len:80 (-) Transcript_19001:123-362(-)
MGQVGAMVIASGPPKMVVSANKKLHLLMWRRRTRQRFRSSGNNAGDQHYWFKDTVMVFRRNDLMVEKQHEAGGNVTKRI